MPLRSLQHYRDITGWVDKFMPRTHTYMWEVSSLPSAIMTGQRCEAEDRELLHSLAAGDMAALAAIYDAHSVQVYHVLLAHLGDGELAEETLAEVFLALVERGRAAATIQNLPAYLIGVARNKARRLHRPRSRVTDDPGRAQVSAGSGGFAERRLEAILVRQALAQLPAEQAEVVVMKIWHELTFQEIGETLAIPANTAASRYRYGLAKLRDLLGEIGDDMGTL